VGKLCDISEFLDLETEHLRLWSIHPKYLDAAGLVALWRESLLAQKILKGKTKGFKNHPQLKRFKMHPYPQRVIANYLLEIWTESKKRGYNFNRRKIGRLNTTKKMSVTSGQLRYEFNWLCDKLKRRDPGRCKKLRSVKKIECHSAFKTTEGEMEDWERGKLTLGQKTQTDF
jgi:hypothetical protein